MSNVPSTLAEFIPWAKTRKAQWTTNQALIGISVAQLAVYKTLVDALVKASDDADNARQASKDATLNLTSSDTAARVIAGAYVNLIKAFAQTTNNPAVYSLAGITPDAPPGTAPAPVPPEKFAATLNADGSLTIRWKAAQPKGVSSVVYQITRALAGEENYTQVGSVGSAKRFIDKTIPFGTDSVSYIVVPVRGNVSGDSSSSFEVRFGSVGGGGFAIASTSINNAGTTSGKLAA